LFPLVGSIKSEIDILKKQRLQHWILAGDIAWSFVALVLAYVMRYGFAWHGPTDGTFLTFFPLFLVAIAVWAVIFSWMKLDGFRRGWDLPATLSQLFLALCLLMAILMAGAYLLRIFLSRLTLSYFCILLFGGFLSIRCTAHAILGSRYLARAVRRVLIVGNGPVAREMAAKIECHPEMLCQVVGFLCSADTSFDTRLPGTASQARMIQTLGVIDLIREERVDEVIITLSKPGSPEVMNLAARCRREGVGVSVVPHPYELYLSKPQLLDLGGLPILQLREAKSRFVNSAVKRTLDMIFGFCLLVTSIPFVAVGAIALLAKRGGPFARELRCGRLGKHFWMYRLNSDRNCRDVSRYEIILQQLSITEMPQLWNVLRGDMSLIGPRPESPDRVKHYSEWQYQRLNVKPGMSGLAQVCGLREEHSSEEKARFDLQYMMHSSLFFDISLILQTGWTLMGRLLRLNRLGSPSAENKRSGAVDFEIERTLPNAHSSQSSAD
jgi:lipopolysaccharide/colanic/teichoic acid biosynthesis glycosyltransferase